jgi:phosphate transport system protein
MSVHMRRDIDNLKRRLLSFSARVEEALSQAVEALNGRDERLAQAIIAADDELDREEVAIEEDCLKILALYQPVATDLRFVVAVLKMNNDLERMGDLAANIAKRAAFAASQPPVELPLDFSRMADKAMSMVNRSLDALVNRDAALARAVCADDDELDAMRKKYQDRIVEESKRHPDKLELLMALSSVYRHLERIGDMATNVAEDVIYMLEGAIIRHGGPKQRAD